METKTKERCLGFLVALVILFIFLFLLFHSTRPERPQQAPNRITHGPPTSSASVAASSVPTTQTPKALEAAPTVSRIDHELPLSSDIAADPGRALTPHLKQHHAVPAHQVTHDPVPVPAPVSAPVPSDAVAAEAWCLQLGAFANAGHVHHLVKLLRSQGFDVYTRSTLNTKYHPIVQVFLGPDLQKARVEQWRRQLQASLHLEGRVRHYQALPIEARIEGGE